MLHVICTGLRPGLLSVHVGDSLRRSEEIVKDLELCLSMQLLLPCQECQEVLIVRTVATVDTKIRG